MIEKGEGEAREEYHIPFSTTVVSSFALEPSIY
jgi:hypothetical protein